MLLSNPCGYTQWMFGLSSTNAIVNMLVYWRAGLLRPFAYPIPQFSLCPHAMADARRLILWAYFWSLLVMMWLSKSGPLPTSQTGPVPDQGEWVTRAALVTAEVSAGPLNHQWARWELCPTTLCRPDSWGSFPRELPQPQVLLTGWRPPPHRWASKASL